MPTGSERRRRDLYGRTRRLLYGLLLLAATPGAAAADELTYLGQYREQARPVAAAPEAVLATLQGLVMIHAEPAADPATPVASRQGHPRMALDTVTARLQAPAGAPLFRVAIGDGREMRDGVGFDLAVPDFGHFHLNLYARRNARTEGRRWAVNAEGEQGPGSAWSLGGTLELVRTLDGERHVAFVPELAFDLSSAQPSYLPFQASLKLAHWRSFADRRALDERVPQLAFQWRL